MDDDDDVIEGGRSVERAFGRGRESDGKYSARARIMEVAFVELELILAGESKGF